MLTQDPCCTACQEALPSDGKTRKRNRPRRCHECNVQAARARMQTDPVRLLSHRYNNACRRLYGQECDPRHWSLDVARFVWHRFGGKSVVSDTADPALLCLFAYRRSATPPAPEELVLVTSREAQSISRATSEEERRARFPPHIQQQMETQTPEESPPTPKKQRIAQ